MYTRYFWQGNHRIYGHIRGIYTVLANPKYLMISLPSILCMQRVHRVLADPSFNTWALCLNTNVVIKYESNTIMFVWHCNIVRLDLVRSESYFWLDMNQTSFCHVYNMYRVGQNHVYTPYIYGSGQSPNMYNVLNLLDGTWPKVGYTFDWTWFKLRFVTCIICPGFIRWDLAKGWIYFWLDMNQTPLCHVYNMSWIY